MSGNGRVVLNLNPLLEVYSVTVLFIGMQAAFSIFNCIVKKQVSCWDERNLRSVIATFLLLCLIVYSVHRFFFGHLILQSLSFTTYSFDELSLWTVFVVVYAIGITDYVISYVAMATKCVVIALPRACLSFERRGRFFQFIESLYQLYQFLIPLPLWISFVSDSTGLYWFIGGVLGSLYVIWKLFETYHKLCKCKAFFKSILQHSPYGSRPSYERMQEEQTCPICLDNFTNPVEIPCMHIFCEECVTSWFDTGKNTCPNCMARVAYSREWRDGSTSNNFPWF